jgi:DNA-binding MarR family transcriptional regulator
MGYWIGRLHSAIHAALEKALAPEGISVAQWQVLITVHQGTTVTPVEVARHIDIVGGAVTRLVDRLVEKRLLVREFGQADRRSQRLVLTDQGRELVPKLARIVAETEAAFLAALQPEEQAAFRKLLAKLLRAQGVRLPPRWG